MCHGSFLIIEKPIVIKHDKRNFNNELGNGFYLFFEASKKEALRYAFKTYDSKKKTYPDARIVINYYKIKNQEAFDKANKLFDSLNVKDHKELIASFITRSKLDNCHNPLCEDCEICNDKNCIKHNDILISLIFDGSLDEEIINKYMREDDSKLKVLNRLHNYNNITKENNKQIRIKGNIDDYINYIGCDIYTEDEVIEILDKKENK